MGNVFCRQIIILNEEVDGAIERRKLSFNAIERTGVDGAGFHQKFEKVIFV